MTLGVNMPAAINLTSYFIEMACAIVGILNRFFFDKTYI